MKEARIAALKTAIDKAGGIVAFRKAEGVTHQSVYRWMKRGHVPIPRAVQIEQRYGVPYLTLIDPAIVEALEAASSADLL